MLPGHSSRKPSWCAGRNDTASLVSNACQGLAAGCRGSGRSAVVAGDEPGCGGADQRPTVWWLRFPSAKHPSRACEQQANDGCHLRKGSDRCERTANQMAPLDGPQSWLAWSSRYCIRCCPGQERWGRLCSGPHRGSLRRRRRRQSGVGHSDAWPPGQSHECDAAKSRARMEGE